jgi:hypothetical protein
MRACHCVLLSFIGLTNTTAIANAKASTRALTRRCLRDLSSKYTNTHMIQHSNTAPTTAATGMSQVGTPLAMRPLDCCALLDTTGSVVVVVAIVVVGHALTLVATPSPHDVDAFTQLTAYSAHQLQSPCATHATRCTSIHTIVYLSYQHSSS